MTRQTPPDLQSRQAKDALEEMHLRTIRSLEATRSDAQQSAQKAAPEAPSPAAIEEKPTGADKQDVRGKEADSPTGPTDQNNGLVRLSSVAPEAVSWLWPGWLPAGKIVVLDGDPSLGKSTLALTFAAHVSTGRAWPDGARCIVGDVVVLSAEDGLADTIRPRLDAAGGDPKRVHALTGKSIKDQDGNPLMVPVTLADIPVITEAVETVRAVLLIVDVLMAYLPGKVDSHRDQDVRVVLARLAVLGENTGCTVLLLRHLNKATGGSAVYRGGGSIGIIGAARAGYLAAPDPDDDSIRVLACTKNNLAAMPPSLKYRLESAPDSHVARIVWCGESEHRAGDLLNASPEKATARERAFAFLDKYLCDNGGAVRAADVQEAAAKQGFSKTTLDRAAEKLGVQKEKDGMNGPWWWRHPEDQSPREARR